MMRVLLALLALLIATPSFAAWPGAKKKQEEPEEETEEDKLSLVALLIKDGHWDRAQLVLEDIDPTDETIDPVRYRTLAGLVAFQQRDWETAVVMLSEARALGATEKKLGLYVALGLVELELYQAALDEARGLLGDEVEPWILLGEALRRARRADEASLLLEEARLRFPTDPTVTVQLAGAHLEADRPLSAGLLLEREARHHPQLAQEGAECLRRAGRLHRALALNVHVPDSASRYRQRLGILLEKQDWARAAALQSRLDRTGVLEDDSVAYALAYARFRAGDLGGSSDLLGGIADPDVFRQSTALREAIAQCEAEPARCD